MSKREEIIKLYFLEGEIPADIAKKIRYFKKCCNAGFTKR